MGVITSLFEKRTGVANPAQWLIDWVNGETSSSGIATNEKSALKYPPVWAAVNIIASAVGALPLVTYKRLARGKERAPTHPVYKLLHDRPNPLMDALTFRETLQGHILTWGNGYAEIERDRASRPVNLWPLPPDKTEPRLENGLLFYEYKPTGGEPIRLAADLVLHIKGLSFGGYKGYSPIHQHMESLGLGRAAEKYGAKFFGQGSRPSGVFEHPGQLKDEAAKRLRTSWESMHQGLDNAHRVAILEEGMKWNQIGIPPEEAQFLQTRKFAVADVSRMYQVPPHMLAEMDKATFSNIEHQGIDFVTYTPMRWLKKWEGECNRKLFGPSAGNKNFCEFLVEGLLRGDSAARSAFYREMFNNGFLTLNEVRELENRNPASDPNADKHFVNAALKPLEDIGKEPEPAPPPAPAPAPAVPDDDGNDDESDNKDDDRTQSVIAAHRGLLLELCRRIVHKETNAMGKAAKKPATFPEAVERFYEKHAEHVREVLGPAVEALAASLGTERARLVLSHGYVGQFAHDHVNASRHMLLESKLLALKLSDPQKMAEKIIQELCNATSDTDKR